MDDIKLVREIRELTGCGIADCNKALNEMDNNMEKAIDWLRKKSISKNIKKTTRATSEGVIGVYVEGNKGVILEVNSETDFVARNEKFHEFVSELSKLLITCDGDIEKLKELKYPKTGEKVSDELSIQISVIRENLNIRRSSMLHVSEGIVSSYTHNMVVPGLGKIGVLLAIESSANKAKLEELGKKIAMHIAATKPEFLRIEDVTGAKLEKEKEVFREQAKSSGKPENIIEKMIEGRIKKYYEESVLLEQPFVMDDKKKVRDIVDEYAKEANTNIELKSFTMFILGEGIEKGKNI